MRNDTYMIREIRILGVSRMRVKVETHDLEAFREECARTYKVKKVKVKFVYDSEY